MHSSAGYTFLVHEDKSVVMDDFDFLRTVERNAFALVLSDDSYDAEIKDDESYLSDIRPLLEKAEKYGTGLFVTDQLADDIEIFQTGIDDVDSIRGNFELIIINLNRSLVKRSETDKVDVILKIFSKIKTGGIILIPENTYQLLSNGRRSVEALIKVLDYKIELPPYDIKDVIIASKRL